MKKLIIKSVLQVLAVLFFLVLIYFLLPYILQIFGVKSFVIVTNSMEHKKIGSQAIFEEFWANRNISLEDVPFLKGFSIGDLVIIDGSPDSYSVGDVVVTGGYADGYIRTHRMYEYNQTHFSQIADGCLNQERNSTVWLVEKRTSIVITDNPDAVDDADKIYQGPAYYKCAQPRLDSSKLSGKVVFAFPFAGQLHRMIYPYDLEKLQAMNAGLN